MATRPATSPPFTRASSTSPIRASRACESPLDWTMLLALVFVVAADEIHGRGLVAAPRRAIEDHQGADQFFGAARIARIGVKDVAPLVLVKGAEARQLLAAMVGIDLSEVVEDLAAR